MKLKESKSRHPHHVDVNPKETAPPRRMLSNIWKHRMMIRSGRNAVMMMRWKRAVMMRWKRAVMMGWKKAVMIRMTNQCQQCHVSLHTIWVL
jgi:hypothetical protein